jgi:hypothetical protein
MSSFSLAETKTNDALNRVKLMKSRAAAGGRARSVVRVGLVVVPQG